MPVDLDPGVVGVPAAGEHGVGLLAGLVAGEEAVAGVGGDALGGVDGGGVAEFDGLGDVVGGQGELVVVAQVLDVEGAVAVDGGDAASGRRCGPRRSRRWSRVRLLRRVITMSPTLAWLPSDSSTSRPGSWPCEPGGAGGGVELGDLRRGWGRA